jgi:hypothetical protein
MSNVIKTGKLSPVFKTEIIKIKNELDVSYFNDFS